MHIYTLVTARSDKKLGPQMHPTTIDCAALAAQSTRKEKEGKALGPVDVLVIDHVERPTEN